MNKRRRRSRLLRIKQGALTVTLLALASNCDTSHPHKGRLPFTWMEKPPQAEGPGKQRLTVVHRHGNPKDEPSARDLGRIQAGDVIAFTMTHREAWRYLRKGKIQKIPYELFRYGHLALVVPDPDGPGGLRLLQVAMNQAVNANDGLDYLNGRTWEIHRPPSGSTNTDRLVEFTRRATEKASDPRRAYDYLGISGWKNAPWQPERPDEIGERFSCATLVVAGLHYAGYELDAVHRGGRLDLVTPRQVVESHGSVRRD